MPSHADLRRCLRLLLESGTPDGAGLCTAALVGAPPAAAVRAPDLCGEPVRDDWASLLRASPEQLLAAVVLRTPVPPERLTLTLDARLTNSVRANDLPSGATFLHAATVAGLGHRPTVARGLDLLLAAALPDGGFADAWRGGTTVSSATTVRCAWVIAEAYRPGFTQAMTRLAVR